MSSTGTFRFSPKILSRLGEELNQTADQSIGELVKNAYDADATVCKIELKNVAQVGGSVTVEDNGDGMSAESIIDKWLVLGRSQKDPNKSTRGGRIPAGSKGLGRLAALRMGSHVRLTTIERSNSRRSHSLDIDWSRFDSADVVESVELAIQSKKNTAGGHGTSTQISYLREKIDSTELRRLARSLVLLTDPFDAADHGFKVELIASEFKEIEALMRKKYFDDAEFHLRAQIKQGIAQFELLDWQGQKLATAKPRSYLSPDATFDIWTFNLGSDEFGARKASLTELKAWFKAFGGVHVYQDGIRVSPYGNPGNDWLEMNLSRVKSPELRPSTNNSIGRVLVSGKSKLALVQKTDRTGFIESEAYLALREFCTDALDWLAQWRLKEREAKRGKQKTESGSKAQASQVKVRSIIDGLKGNAKEQMTIAFDDYQKVKDKETNELRKEIQLYRTLSTAGITAAVFAHESQLGPIKQIDISANTLKSRIAKLKNPETEKRLNEPLAAIEKACASLSSLGSATLNLVMGKKRRVGKVQVHQIIDATLQLLESILERMQTSVERSYCAGSPSMRTSQAALESIFTNLLNNAVTAMKESENRRILVATTESNGMLEVVVADSGPGVPESEFEHIWLPGYSTREDGTGLGLTIVKDTLTDMGGAIELISPGRLGGAEFSIRLPILGN